MRYRKTALVEATRWHKPGDHPAVGPHPDKPDWGRIETKEGPLEVEPGTWIAGPGAAGEHWPINDAVFRATYEPAEGDGA
jgi:hypothetical protein